MSSVLHFFVRPSGHEGAASAYTQRKLRGELPALQGIKTELCYNVNWTGWASYQILGRGTKCRWECLKVSLPSLPAAESFPSAEEMKKLTWLFGCPLLLDDVAQESWLLPGSNDLLLEVGPRHVALTLGQLHGPEHISPSKHTATSSTLILLPPLVILGKFVFLSCYSLPRKLCPCLPLVRGYL